MKMVSAMVLTIIYTLFLPCHAAEPNIDGGGGDMGCGTSNNSWSPGNDGVRITIVRADDGSPVSQSVDFTNTSPNKIAVHFGKICKTNYNHSSLSPQTSTYIYVNPASQMPQIISSSGSSNIEAIKSYFCDELVIRYIADKTGFNYDILIAGSYKLLIEPIAYFRFNGVNFAMTAHEASLYNQAGSSGHRWDSSRIKTCRLRSFWRNRT